MKVIIDTFRASGNLHHAYVVSGDTSKNIERVKKFIEEDVKMDVHGNPDVWIGEFETFGIDDARALREVQNSKSVRGGRKVFVVMFDAVTHEAQNALLKTLEEPTPHSHFFLVTASTGTFLPTLLSRVVVVNEAGDGGEHEQFLSLLPGARLEFLKRKDFGKADALRFLSSLEREAEALLRSKGGQHYQKAVHELLTVKSYMFDRSSSVKMLLEHLALYLPKIPD